MDNSYFELRMNINPEIEDLISDIFFFYFDCEGIVLAEETYKDLEMVSTTEGTVKIFLRSDEKDAYESLKYDIENVLDISREKFLARGLTDEELGSWSFELEEKKTEDWAKKWKEKWTVTHVTDKIAVVPEWIEYTPKENEVTIKMEPGCAFGTGTHQTTQLCMKALEKYMNKGDKVADIGMGSGILSILAKKLGAGYVYGCDNDETVIEVACDNMKRNLDTYFEDTDSESIVLLSSNRKLKQVSSSEYSFCFELCSIENVRGTFDFVCANILHFVLAEIMGDLKRITRDGGYISLSGILDEKKQMVLDAIKRENLKIVEEIHQDQWTSYVVQK